MCGCRSLLRRTCPPPPHIKKAFDLKKWYYIPPSLHPLPLLKGGEGWGEEGSYIHVLCLFGALLVTSYHLQSKTF
jgi:hypothetical protein